MSARDGDDANQLGWGTARLLLLEAALAYARRGWPVFPCEPGGKRPLGKLAPHGLRDATIDTKQIREWWSTEPKANIGLVTGVNFDVLDIDGEAGRSSVARAVSRHGCLAISPVTLTGGGGGHYLYLPTGARCRIGFLDHVDWKAEGGYIVAPPSVHPNGARYEWVLTPDEVPIEAAPEWLVALVSAPPVAANRAGVTVRQGHATAYGRRALEDECGRVALTPEGRRNPQVNASAFAIGQLVGSGLLDAEEAGQALLKAAMLSGLGEDEATRTIRSGMAAGIRSPRKVAS